jgi:hypothetical protein
MKFTPPNSRFSYMRIAMASALVIAATALGFTAVKMSSPGPVLLGKSDAKGVAPNKFRKDFDDAFDNKRTIPGPDHDLGPVAAAYEEYVKRAYPAVDIPITATLNAQTAFNKIKNRSVAKRVKNNRALTQAKASTSQWTLVGPSSANFPGVLTFSGADYTTSGRITALAISPVCNTGHGCRAWAAAAGGGVWRTDNALSGNGAGWTFVSGSFATNAIGALTYDSSSNTLYAGTGEPNASADSEAGLGLYKSTNGGDTWTLLPAVTSTTISGVYTGNAFLNRAISEIVVDPTNSNILYVSSASAIRGVASVLNGADAAPPVPLPARGVYKSTDGGATFTLLNSATSGLPFVVRGAVNVKLDPSNPNTIYASQFSQGVYRSTDGGTNWTKIFAGVNPASAIERDSIAVAALSNGHTRMYLGAGDNGTFTSRYYRSDLVETGTPVFSNMTTTQNAGYCATQCWYDNVVYTPPGQPDKVFLGGSFDYNNYGGRNNGRAFIYSTDAGVSWTDQTWDATTTPKPPDNCCNPTATSPNGMHPDSHAIVQIPGTDSYIFGCDGGLTRTSGDYTDASAQCATRGLSPTNLAVCQQLLSRIPTFLYNLNKGLSTLQFQSVSVAADNPKHVQGGTQDNGTFETYGSAVVWPQIIYGDGGQSGFSATNSALRFNTFTGQANDVNFQNGDPLKWVIASGPIISSPEGAYFYTPIISDPNPAAAGTIFQGSQSVWRTQDWAGDQAFLEANCPEFTTSAANPACGDFVRIGPSGPTAPPFNSDLTAAASDYRGTTRAGTFVGEIARTPSDTATLWVATGTGRVFISKNADAAAGSVTFTRLDTLPSATADPNRFVTSIAIDPANPNHAWISYSGYNANTPTTPGHVFSVTYNPAIPDATWTNIDGGTGPMGDLPVTDLVQDSVTGDLYASTDFGVLRLPAASSSWIVAGAGLPMVEVPGLTIVPGARLLYAATHGRSAWALKLP